MVGCAGAVRDGGVTGPTKPKSLLILSVVVDPGVLAPRRCFVGFSYRAAPKPDWVWMPWIAGVAGVGGGGWLVGSAGGVSRSIGSVILKACF